MAQSVGTQSLWLISSLVTVPGLITPGQRTRQGTRKAPSQLVFFSRAEPRHRAVGPGVHVRAVVAGVDDDGVVRDAHVVQRLEQGADRVVVLDHAVDVLAVAVLVAAAVLGADVRAQVHARRVEPDEERLARGLLPLHEVDGRGRGLVVDRLHALLGERAGVLDGLLADLAEARIDGRIVLVGGLGLEHAARAELGAVGRVLRIVGQFRLFLGVEMVEVAEELVEPVDRRQRLVAVADVVLAELARGVAEVLEQAADGGIELAHAHRRAREAHLGKAGANAMLAGEERRAAGGARLLAVVVEEPDALSRDAVDVGRFVAHQPVAVGADVGDADVVAEDDEDVGLAPTRRRFCACACSTRALVPSAPMVASAVPARSILRRPESLRSSLPSTGL